jgi:hypothetical protein
MVEEQQHGFAFQKWVIGLAKCISPDKVAKGTYTGKWDLPAELNPNRAGGPVSIKVAKWNSTIAFGDALRQFQINEDFTLIVGFWERVGMQKRVVKVVCVQVLSELWASLWKPVTLSDLETLDGLIKNRTYDYREARRRARQTVAAPPFKDSIFRVNPKIDSKHQRRLQCSLTQRKFFEHLARGVSPERDASPALWGHAAPLFLPGRPRFGAS